MKKLFLIAFFAIITVSGISQSWVSDPNHSRLGFTVTHFGISDITGNFEKFSVTINSTAKDFSDAVIELNTDVSSINTGISPRDKHLRSADFFDVEKYPTMTFKSTSIKKTGNNLYELSGDLTLHGITKPVTMILKFRGTTESKGRVIAGLQVTGMIKRSDFNIGGSFPNAVISDEVEIKADGEFSIQK